MRLIDADLIQYEPMLSPKGNGMYEDVMVAYKSQINDLPTIERKKGKWIVNNEYIDCSVCRHEKWSRVPYKDLVKRFKFCPNCGADMRGDRNEID